MTDTNNTHLISLPKSAVQLYSAELTPTGRSISLGKGWKEFTGRRWWHGMGKGYLKSIHPDDVYSLYPEMFYAIKTGQPFKISPRLKHKDGTYHQVICITRPVRDSWGRHSHCEVSVFKK